MNETFVLSKSCKWKTYKGWRGSWWRSGSRSPGRLTAAFPFWAVGKHLHGPTSTQTLPGHLPEKGISANEQMWLKQRYSSQPQSYDSHLSTRISIFTFVVSTSMIDFKHTIALTRANQWLCSWMTSQLTPEQTHSGSSCFDCEERSSWWHKHSPQSPSGCIWLCLYEGSAAWSWPPSQTGTTQSLMSSLCWWQKKRRKKA